MSRGFCGFLKQSTAVTVCLGPFVDRTDDYTPESGLATNMDGASGILLSKNGGAMALRASGLSSTAYDINGFYRAHLGASDTNTLGDMVVSYTETATTKPRSYEYTIVPANIYDSLVAGTDNLQVDTTQINGSASGASGIADLGVSGYNASTHKVAGVVLTDTTTNLTNAASSGDFTSTQKASITTAVNAATGMVAASVTNPVTVSGDFSSTMKTSIASGVRQELDTTPVSGTPVSGTIGYLNKTYLDAAVSSRLGPTGVLSTVTNLTNAPGAGDFTSTMKASLTSGINAASGMVVASVAGAVGSVTSKTGFKLASDGLDAVAAPTDLANDAAARATFVGMFRAIFNRFYNAVTQSSTQQIVKNDSAVAVSTMAVSVASGVESKGKSS